MPSTENVDILVIGSGEAGKYLAWTMAGEGRRTAVVERSLIGGSCPNIACLPSKNIIHSAKVRWFATRAAEFGVEAESVATDMTGVQARKRAMVDGLRQLHLDRYRASGAELIMGGARFVGERTVDVELVDGGTRRISGERVFLNLGTHASMPDVPGLAAARPMTHIELLDLDRLPEHLIVIGGGYIGLELAQAMRRFGAKVTVVDHGPQLARSEDADVGAAILELFRDEGITVQLGAEVRSVEGASGDRVRVVTGSRGGDVVEGTDLLVATGRTPNTSGIGLELAGVTLTESGYIAVDEHLATTAANVWAMGECAGSPQFTHASFDDFRIVYDNVSGGSSTTRDRLLAYCMYTDPELARVGLTESEARRRGVRYRLLSMPMAAVLRTRTLSEPRGFMKMLIAADSDDILGFTVFGAEASEPMAVVQTAMVGRLPYPELRRTVFVHPTMSEGLTFLLRNTPTAPTG
ncbi:dihydrolipoyl dehydrogenase family protein [Rugosimonospora africana]|uniref:Mercuric reductase n=1 Tax=Rugosimonospora africana TaxID=556532 RepID=A0A8J3VR23_9ACTN|nr:FAD-dependent oxidoreductase [Rugosimonospora africana]GIH15101.1 mercuric reductase [Rugosimonospora africana]